MVNVGQTVWNNRNNAPKTYNFTNHPQAITTNLGGVPNWQVTTGVKSGSVPVIPATPALGAIPSIKNAVLARFPTIFNIK